MLKPSLLSLIVAGFALAPASAEVFVLRSGGRIEGLHVNADNKWGPEYIVRTADGGEVTIARTDVKEVIRIRDAELAYDRVAPTYADTIEDQLKLAEWCREQFLSAQEKAHLRRVLELDPDNAKIRNRLGYRKFQGEWLTEQQVNERQGLVKYRGKARTAQEIELIEERTLVDQKQKTWYQTIKRWREDLDSRDTEKSTLAKTKLLEINDPYAVKALAYYYKDESDRRNDPVRSRLIKLWIVEVLGRIGTPEALTALVEYSLVETDDDIRLTCYEAVGKARASASTNRYIAALKDKDNNVVQGAAIGLRYIGDRRAVGPLVDALITQHTFELQAQGATGPGSINSTFDKSGGGVGGLSGGGGGLGVNQKPQRVRKSFLNEEVHRTLTSMTGQDFQFNQKLWKKWLSTQKEAPQFDGRRN